MKKTSRFITSSLLAVLILGVSACFSLAPERGNPSDLRLANIRNYFDTIHNPPVKSTDSEEIKQKKLQKTEFINQMKKAAVDIANKENSGTATAEDEIQYKKQLEIIGNQLDALGLDPTEDVDKGQFFDKQVDGFISDCYIAMGSYCDNYGNVINKDDNKEKYDAVVKRRAYLVDLKANYESGKISGEEAFDALNTYSSGCLMRLYTGNY